MPHAVERYAAHRRSDEAWMLGRFVVPVEQLDDVAGVSSSVRATDDQPWRLSAIVGAQSGDAFARIAAFNAQHRDRFIVDVAECRAPLSGSIADLMRESTDALRVFVEMPLVEDPRPMLDEIVTAGAWAKMRTGGVTPDAIPPARAVARLIACAAAARVPFKATAGLHHPITGAYALTYDAQPRHAIMYGFLNVFAAAFCAQQGAPESLLVSLLEEQRPHAIELGDAGLRWRDSFATPAEIATARSTLAISFGSCSFTEPVDGLRALGLL
jgi:hypothetical protein